MTATHNSVGTSSASSASIIFVFVTITFLLMLVGMTDAQEDALSQATQAWEIYLERDVLPDSTDSLQFLNVLTGETNSLQIDGERYTLLPDSILFFDRNRNRVRQAFADGSTRNHDFIQIEGGARRVDWVISEDQRAAVWTLTYGEGESMSTVTYVAQIDGSNRREILNDGPRSDGIRALPVAFTGDETSIVMDAQPDGLSRFTAYAQYAGLFQVSLVPDTFSVQLLPGEPDCFCGATIRADQFLRLSLTDDATGFNVLVHDLVRGSVETIPAMNLSNYTQAGDLLIAPDGRQAVYALSQIENFGAVNQSVRTVFVLVDLETMTQGALTQPITTYVHPIRWTEENTAVLFTSPQINGTWKISLEDGLLIKVADATYLGLLRG